MRILVTGGAGFIGSAFVLKTLHEMPDVEVTNVDSLTYAGNLDNLKAIESNPKYRFIHADISDRNAMQPVFEEIKPEIVFHLAAESHVDRSIIDSGAFIRTNVLGTQVLLDCSRAVNVRRFVHISTDEVYGMLSLEDAAFTESTKINPSSPYSASKAAGDLLAASYFHTHKFPIVITRASNNYGPRQFPEKFIPLFTTNAIQNLKLPLYGTGTNIRDWIHVNDHVNGIWLAALKGREGEVYNLGGESERSNIEVAKEILRILGKSESLIQYVTDRPGHDFRYAMNITKARTELGFEPKYSFKNGLEETVKWYMNNPDWWQRVKSGEYRKY